MDGGGRLARSQRSPGPRTNLKAAAIGAVVLLRERLGFGRARARARPVSPRPEREQLPPRLIALLERYIPHRAGIAATVLMLLGSAGFGVVRGGHLEELTSAASDTRNAIANSAGFRITAVAINGRRQLTQDEVLAIGGVTAERVTEIRGAGAAGVAVIRAILGADDAALATRGLLRMLA